MVCCTTGMHVTWRSLEQRMSHGGVRCCRSDGGLVHARAVSLTWGFADDVLAQVRCGAAGSVAILEAQVP